MSQFELCHTEIASRYDETDLDVHQCTPWMFSEGFEERFLSDQGQGICKMLLEKVENVGFVRKSIESVNRSK